jgi:hypothetical protein
MCCAAPRRPTPTASSAAPTKSASRRTTPCRGCAWCHPREQVKCTDWIRSGRFRAAVGPVRSGRGRLARSAASERRSAASRRRAMGVMDGWSRGRAFAAVAVRSRRGPVVLAVGARHPGALYALTDIEIRICIFRCISVCVYMYIYSYSYNQTYVLEVSDL